MARVTVREKIAPYIEQGFSVKEISEITGYCYNTVRYAVFPEKRSGKKKEVSDDKDNPKGWCIGWNKDRKKCKTCQYKSRNPYLNNCDYILHEGHSRVCNVADCDKYVKGRRLRINEKGGWNSKEDDCFVD